MISSEITSPKFSVPASGEWSRNGRTTSELLAVNFAAGRLTLGAICNRKRGISPRSR